MTWSPEDVDWLEREWAYRAHGRAGLMSPEDFHSWRAWEADGLSVDLVVGALNAYFDRRDKRARPRTFVALKHIGKDVEKAAKLQEALRRAGPALDDSPDWESVVSPLREDATARSLFQAWRRASAALPEATDPAYLERFDEVRDALARLAAQAEACLGTEADALRGQLRQRLLEAELKEDGPLWARAWRHHWTKAVLGRFGIPVEG